jgi:hypothetical protein
MIQYGWAILMVGSMIGAIMRGIQAWNAVSNPEVFKRELLPYLIWFGLGLAAPWAMMGAFLTSGLVPDAELFLARAQSNVWVTLWRWLFFLETVGLVGWISLGTGARFLVRYPFLINVPKANERVVRAAAGLIWVMFWAILIGNMRG